MILQALYALAQSEELMSDPDYQQKPVAWLIRIGDGGEFHGLTGTHTIPQIDEATASKTQKAKKPKPVPKILPVPYQKGRSGRRAPAYFFVDNAKYVFGKPTKDKEFDEADGREKANDFLQGVRACAEATNDPGVRAILDFLENVAQGQIDVELPEQCLSNEQFAFIYSPDIDRPVHLRPAIRDYWKRMRVLANDEGEAAFRCIVTGEPLHAPGLFPKMQKVPSVSTPGGAGLVSFNSNVFESYGLKKNQNAPVSQFAAESCATAMNRLLDPEFPDPNRPGQKMPPRNYRISANTVVCFWAVEPGGQDLCNILAGMMEARPEKVKVLYQSIWRGRVPAELDASAFYAITLSGTQGRAIVRDWLESTVRDVATAMARYFTDLAIVRNTPKPREHDLPPHLPLSVLLRSLAPQGKSDNIPSHMAAQMARAALSGKRYPLSVFHRALERMRAEIGGDDWGHLERRDARAALIKAILIRNFHKEVTPAMDPNNQETGYLLGRLLAIIERVQQLAMGDINATVIDRYFSGASANPGTVFPRLLKNMRHHVSKARDQERGGYVLWLDRQADAILAQINGFPSFLPLDQQGMFVLGYHHERHELWKKREAAAPVEAAQASDASE